MMKITNHLEEISVYERRSDYFCADNPGITIIQDKVEFLHSKEKELYLTSGKFNKLIESIINNISFMIGTIMKYDKLCICSGASPIILKNDHPNIIGIRDLEVFLKFIK